MADLNRIWELMVIYGIATDAEINLVTDINGYTEETLNDIIFARTGYRNLEQYEDAELGTDEDEEPADLEYNF